MIIYKYNETLEIVNINKYTTGGGMSHLKAGHVEFSQEVSIFRSLYTCIVRFCVLHLTFRPVLEGLRLWSVHPSSSPWQPWTRHLWNGIPQYRRALKPELIHHIFLLLWGSTPGILLLGHITALLSTLEGYLF